MSPKHASLPDAGPVTRGKGLDTLDRFIIQNWAPPTRFALWHGPTGTLVPPRVSLEHFLNEALKAGWQRDGGGAVITIDPPRDPFVVLEVTYETKHWTPDAKYHPKHWLWKVVPLEGALDALGVALGADLPEAEAGYLQALREGKLKEAWDARS